MPRIRLALLLALPVILSACGSDQGTLEDPGPDLPADRPSFDGGAAHDLVEEQVAFGPRVPGTEGHAAQLAWMEDLLAEWADEVEAQPFTATTSGGLQLRLTNLLARYRPQEEDRILLLTHWDTRPWSDQAADPHERAIPVPGANDGASGTAVLLQLAELLSVGPPPMGVDLLFVDGEDFGPGIQDMFLGSKDFAANLPDPIPWRYGLLLDMVGDLDPRFPMEGFSVEYAPILTQDIWQIAHELGFGPFFPATVGKHILDDHIPLNEAGLRTVDLIDFDYGPENSFWHTPRDVPENTSPETLRMVGEVVAELVYRGG